MEQYLIKQIETDKGIVNILHALQVKWAGIIALIFGSDIKFILQ